MEVIKVTIDKKNIKSFEYDSNSETLTLKFQNSRVYEYYNVSMSWLIKLLSSEADKVPSELSKSFKYKEIK